MSARTELEAFLTKHLAALEKDEAKHNLILGLLDQATKNPGKLRLWSLGEEAACAVQAPPRHLVLADLDAHQCELLAEQVKDVDFFGCVGSNEVLKHLKAALAKHQIEIALAVPQRIYTLNQSPIYPKAEGKGRELTEADIHQFADWVVAFCREAVPEEPIPTKEEIVAKGMDRPAFFWEVNGQPVAMAARSRETKNGSNIALVYTPPEQRGKGYGGSATAFACEHVFREGKRQAFLYTDLTNPVSNRVYQKIGFKPWCDAGMYLRKNPSRQ